VAPPGLEEVFGLLAILDALPAGRSDDRIVVVDMPPTGHALRLLALAGRAREWVRVLLGLLMKYRPVIGLGPLARELTTLSRDLGRLDALLRDPDATRVVVVSRAAELPRRETDRLVRGLAALGIQVAALLVDAVSEASAAACPRCRRIAGAERRQIARLALPRRRAYPVLLAPAVVPPPRGVAELGRWSRAWAAG
jgi:arsenite-transporting ATPase